MFGNISMFPNGNHLQQTKTKGPSVNIKHRSDDMNGTPPLIPIY